MGLDIDVGVEGVLVEENRASCVMGHVEAIREKLVDSREHCVVIHAKKQSFSVKIRTISLSVTVKTSS